MADNLPLVSVILPTYNCARFLPDTIGSILSQTYHSYEIIVVDDGSTDNTKEVLNPFIQRINYIKLEQNKGAPAARNTGIRLAQGKYIAFLDSDDLWLPEKLQTDIEYLETHPEIGMVYSKHINIDEKGNVLDEPLKKKLPSGNIFLQLFSEQNFIVNSSIVVFKEVFKTTGLLDEQLFYCDDWDICLRIAFSFKVAGINKQLVKYRSNPYSLNKNRINVLKYQKIVIDKIYNEFKNRKNEVSERLYKKRLSLHYAKVGRHYLRIGNKRLANENFRLSLGYNPLNLRAMRYYLYTFSYKSKETI